MLKSILAPLFALFLGILIGFPLMELCRKLKLRQTILHYVDKHKAKAGTPTMGGLIFILAGVATYLIFKGDGTSGLFCLLFMLLYALIGFADDLIKIKRAQNEGLSPWQKLLWQGAVALLASIVVFFEQGTSLSFFGLEVDISFAIFPFVIFFYLAITNSVNLLDGLDGLAGGVSGAVLLCFSAILTICGQSELGLLCLIMAGAVMAFLLFNVFPAKIFMGDTGSLALGGLISTVAALSGLELLLPVVGLMYVLTALSDIVQVLVFKKTGKRVLLMAPLHHHFEKLGVHENRIVTIYIVITLVLGLGCIGGYIAIMGA